MTIHYIIQSVFVIVGLLSLGASVFNCDWFFNAQNSQFIVRNIGRNYARLFYAVIGLAMIGAGVYFYMSVQSLQLKQ